MLKLTTHPERHGKHWALPAKINLKTQIVRLFIKILLFQKIRIQLHWLLPREKAGRPEEFQNFQILQPDPTPPSPPLILLLQAGSSQKKLLRYLFGQDTSNDFKFGCLE